MIQFEYAVFLANWAKIKPNGAPLFKYWYGLLHFKTLWDMRLLNAASGGTSQCPHCAVTTVGVINLEGAGECLLKKDRGTPCT